MVIKADDIQDVRPLKEPDASVCRVHLKNVLKKCEIYDMFNDDQIRLLGNVIEQFKMYNSVNYGSFLRNYFKKVSSEDWPYENEISNFCLVTSLNYQKPSNVQNKNFDEWWRTQ